MQNVMDWFVLQRLFLLGQITQRVELLQLTPPARRLPAVYLFNFTEGEAALGENGAEPVSDLSGAESSHGEDQPAPGTTA